jgi:geranylgeranyl pyrophosphate synthase
MAVEAGVQENVQDPVRLQTVMGPDLQRVTERVIEVTDLSYPVAASIIREIVLAGGKRLRPLLVLLAGRAYQYEARFEELVTAAAGVELLHVASLVHDDTIDRAALRRGKPTLNSVISVGGTILIGDFLFAQSAMLAARTGDVRVVGVFASTLGELCDGQLLELFDAHEIDQDLETYIRRIYGKTASLFAGAAEMGSVLGRAPEAHVQELRQFATEIGLAFQIQDDVLDLTGETGDLGKPAGNDLRQGVITLPTLLFAQGHDTNSDSAQLLDHVITAEEVDDRDVDELISRIRRSGAVGAALEKANGYREAAMMRISTVPDAATRELLSDWTSQALGAT